MMELVFTVCELAGPAVAVMIGITLAAIAMDKVRSGSISGAKKSEPPVPSRATYDAARRCARVAAVP
jgi:hypothetical protein